MHPTNDARPGTGTQIHVFATTPDDDALPSGMRLNGRYWKVGHDYIETGQGDVGELTKIVGRSAWCDTRDPEDCEPTLVFNFERLGQATISPEDAEFIMERYEDRSAAPRSVEYPW